MKSDEPSLAELERLAESAEIADRAFAASVLRLHGRPDDRRAAVYDRIRETALRAHERIRAKLRTRSLDREAFLAEVEAAPIALRDHLVEEILGIAYPPLDPTPLPSDLVDYAPSGLAEIAFMLERAGLGPGATFVDLGAGLGKVVLLVALLTGAHACGVEIDPRLTARATEAAQALDLGHARFVTGDMRDMELPEADVYYMYIPVTCSTDVAARLTTRAGRFLLFSSPLDTGRLPWLRARDEASYWLAMYETG